MDVYEKSLELHKEHQGKLEISVKVPCDTKEDLALAYTPGVAACCLKIDDDKENAYVYTNKGNTVGIISDGSAVLGLGNIGPSAALPVMEGKAVLMKKFADIDAIPLCLNTNDVNEIVSICKALEPNLGGINLEDISAPRCIEIERKLVEEMDIPVFHDDQQGTAIVVLATLINSVKLISKKPEECKVVISGTGAAGSAIIKMIHNYGFKNIYAFDKNGFVSKQNMQSYDKYKKELLNYVNLDNKDYNSIEEAMVNADIFIGVSVKNLVSKEMVSSMNEKNIVLAMANPEPEISYEDAKSAGAYIVGTGRSDSFNQVNNLLAFPGIFRGALDAKATKIDDNAKIAASIALANLISDEKLNPEYVVVSPFDERVVKYVSEAVKKACIKSGNIRG
ncbi:MAG: NADP-dependent malic enzyme [Erysipelotrichaceae bacterium]|nr:NADP-dependent malic enzyme [Erysipelotrichaceae bacterium]